MLNNAKLGLIFSIAFIVFLFVFTKHYIDLSETTESWFVYKGLNYYKDLPIYHFALSRIATLPIHLLFNWTFIESPFIGLFIGIADLILIYLIGTKFLNKTANTVSLMFFSIFWWYLATQITYDFEMLIGLFLMIALFFMLNISQEKKLPVKKLFYIGLFSSLSLLSGQVAAIALAALLLTSLAVAKARKFDFKKSFLWISFGFIVPWIITLSYLIKSNSLYEFYKYNIPYYLTYASDAKPNIFHLPWNYLGLYYSPLLILAIFVLFEFFKRRKINQVELILIILMAASLPFNLLSIYHPRHLLYSLPLVAIAAGFVINHKVSGGIKTGVLLLWGFSIVFSTTTVIFPYYKSHLIYPPTLKIFNDLYPGDKTYETAHWLKDNTPQNSTIMVLGTPMVYLRAERLPASRPNKGIPYSWVPIEEVKKEIQAKPPDYWVVDRQFVARLKTNYPTFNVTDFIENEMLNCYNLVQTFNKWEIWEKDSNCRIPTN